MRKGPTASETWNIDDIRGVDETLGRLEMAVADLVSKSLNARGRAESVRFSFNDVVALSLAYSFDARPCCLLGISCSSYFEYICPALAMLVDQTIPSLS